MNLVVDPGDPTPPYEQLRRQLADLIIGGALVPGARLVPLRQLAGDLGLAVGTVARAYRELEAQGLLVTRRGGGTRVADDVPRPPQSQRRDRLRELAEVYVGRARALGCSEAEIETAVRAAVRPAPG